MKKRYNLNIYLKFSTKEDELFFFDKLTVKTGLNGKSMGLRTITKVIDAKIVLTKLLETLNDHPDIWIQDIDSNSEIFTKNIEDIGK